MARTVLIVDDDPVQRRLMQAAAERHRFRARPVENGEQALREALDPANGVDAVLLDLRMPGISGQEVLERLTARRPDLPVVVLTASGGIETAVAAIKAGAVDFLVKPAAPERIAASIRSALKTAPGEDRTRIRVDDLPDTAHGIVGDAPALQRAMAHAERAARSSIPALILGESGTGKEMMARHVHARSLRSARPFIAVNCGALPPNLVESTLFGHSKGAFTGAEGARAGKFREADGGTLFLDEVGELPPEIQVSLLRALQEGEIDPVGADKPVVVDIRIVSATNRDLEKSVRDGEFREDLYYRLNVFPIRVPSLHERIEDVPALVAHFIARFNAEEKLQIAGIGDEALAMLAGYRWPGNIRQLENAVFRASVLCESDRLGIADFPQIAALTGNGSACVAA